MRRQVIGLLLIVTFLAGCATMTDETRTKAEGTAAGAGIGAALGAGLGYIFGGKDGALIGASAGAATGGLGGYFYGRHVAHRKQEFAKQEDYLDALIASAQNVNAKTVTLRQEIAQLEAETVQLIQQYNERKVQQGQLKTQERAMAKMVKEGQEQLKVLQTEIDIQQETLEHEKQEQNKSRAAVTRLTSLQGEIVRLESNKSKLEEDVKRLVSIEIRPSV